MTRYRVVGEYVTAVVPSAARLIGPHAVTGLTGFHRDAILPEDTEQASLELLLRKGLVQAIEETE